VVVFLGIRLSSNSFIADLIHTARFSLSSLGSSALLFATLLLLGTSLSLGMLSPLGPWRARRAHYQPARVSLDTRPTGGPLGC
jgi:hypothetical protein